MKTKLDSAWQKYCANIFDSEKLHVEKNTPYDELIKIYEEEKIIWLDAVHTVCGEDAVIKWVPTGCTVCGMEFFYNKGAESNVS